MLDESRYHSLANAELKGSVESKGISFYGMNKKMGGKNAIVIGKKIIFAKSFSK